LLTLLTKLVLVYWYLEWQESSQEKKSKTFSYKNFNDRRH
jgi:hypothetical protein